MFVAIPLVCVFFCYFLPVRTAYRHGLFVSTNRAWSSRVESNPELENKTRNEEASE